MVVPNVPSTYASLRSLVTSIMAGRGGQYFTYHVQYLEQRLEVQTQCMNTVAKRLSVFCIFCQFARLNYKLHLVICES